MLKYRLPLGLGLIGALILLLWGDEVLATVALPASLASAVGRGHANAGDFPRGSLLFLVMLPITFMAARELARMLREKQILATTWLTCAAAILGLVVSCGIPEATPGHHAAGWTSTTAMLVMLAALANYSRDKNTQGVIAAAGGTLLAYVYLGLMFGFVLAVRREHSAWVLLWIILTTKMSDTGAYFAGRTFGRHKLIPWLSPGKTWEGLVGGVALASITGALGLLALKKFLPTEPLPSIASGAAAGALAALFGQAGDLVVSLFKRDAGRKDSGHSLPGFGGVLDVLDSPLLVTPLAYWWLRVAS